MLEPFKSETGVDGEVEKNTFRDCEGGRPLITENIETDTTVGVDIWMIDSCRKVHL